MRLTAVIPLLAVIAFFLAMAITARRPLGRARTEVDRAGRRHVSDRCGSDG